jgi:hypothetical protein
MTSKTSSSVRKKNVQVANRTFCARDPNKTNNVRSEAFTAVSITKVDAGNSDDGNKAGLGYGDFRTRLMQMTAPKDFSVEQRSSTPPESERKTI